jgi:sulfite reductase (NADPH) hemoprotein beta-component
MSTKTPDRSRDRSQPLENLGPDETLKATSDYLRGTITEGLADPVTAAIAESDTKLLKFHGMYMQDDRDIRDERRRQKLEPEFTFMARVRLAGGVCNMDQWLKLDQLGRDYGGNTLRLTTRQTFQLHRIDKWHLKDAIQGMREVLLDTRGACGDGTRGVMAAVNPEVSPLHAEVYDCAVRASNFALAKSGAYSEIWYDVKPEPREPGPDGKPAEQEPFYGRTYMPRKFKIGFAIPPSNDIDVYSQDLGFIAIEEDGELVGFNVAVGGGLGRTDSAPETYPRVASVIGYIEKNKLMETIQAIMGIQRDHGDRVTRAHARFKYTVDDLGLEFVRQETERRLGFGLQAARDYEFTSNGDALGWVEAHDGKWHYTLFIENGRVIGDLMDGLKALAEVHEGTYNITPNQNVTIAGVAPEKKGEVEDVLKQYGLFEPERGRSQLRLNSMACVALPTCGLAMAESERYLPELIDKIDVLLDNHGLREEPITIRMTGCPNGCARPYIAEIALTGRAPGKYNLYLGGGFHGQRLNKMLLENVGEEAILSALDDSFGRYAAEREEGERFGDFAIRAGIVPEVTEGRFFND